MHTRHCIASGCKRLSDVLVRYREGTRAAGELCYCRRHAKRGSDPIYVPQPATIIVLAGRYWDASRRDGGKPKRG